MCGKSNEYRLSLSIHCKTEYFGRIVNKLSGYSKYDGWAEGTKE